MSLALHLPVAHTPVAGARFCVTNESLPSDNECVIISSPVSLLAAGFYHLPAAATWLQQLHHNPYGTSLSVKVMSSNRACFAT